MSSDRARARTSSWRTLPLETLADESSELAGELERDGLISGETVRRIACDATVIVAVDDDVGHTMYEGRARRLPTETQRREIIRRDRHCRFPGCTNVTFTNVHHVGSGSRVGGPIWKIWRCSASTITTGCTARAGP